jgi:hypothetical protein
MRAAWKSVEERETGTCAVRLGTLLSFDQNAGATARTEMQKCRGKVAPDARLRIPSSCGPETTVEARTECYAHLQRTLKGTTGGLIGVTKRRA